MSKSVSRRRFLESAAAVGAAAASFELLPPSLQNALAEPVKADASLNSIEHIVIFIQENRSFDHYFGTLSGVRGFDDPHAKTLPSGRSVFYQPDPLNPDGYELPFHLDTRTTAASCPPSLSHAWTAQHQSWDGGKMDNWLPAHRAADGTAGPMTMGYYRREDIPFHFSLADWFTVCDMYFCSVFGPTNPNRLYSMTGTIDPDGDHGGPVVDNSETPPYTWTTYPERLQQAGISWRVYQGADNYDDNPLAWFKQYQTAPKNSPLYLRGIQPQADPIAAFAEDVRTNNLPQVSWIVAPAAASEHPSYLPAAGSQFTYDLLQALGSNPDVWNKTVFVLTYDENDGYFDHVVPPTPPPGTPDEYITGTLPPAAGGIAGPIGLGFRVPTIVISPWSRGGWVCSDVFDHTSLIRLIERRFGVREPQISAWRRQTCGDLTETLRFNSSGVFPAMWNPGNELLRQYVSCNDYPAPTVPTQQSMPHQDPGTRPHTG